MSYNWSVLLMNAALRLANLLCCAHAPAAEIPPSVSVAFLVWIRLDNHAKIRMVVGNKVAENCAMESDFKEGKSREPVKWSPSLTVSP